MPSNHSDDDAQSKNHEHVCGSHFFDVPYGKPDILTKSKTKIGDGDITYYYPLACHERTKLFRQFLYTQYGNFLRKTADTASPEDKKKSVYTLELKIKGRSVFAI